MDVRGDPPLKKKKKKLQKMFLKLQGSDPRCLMLYVASNLEDREETETRSIFRASNEEHGTRK